MLIFISWFWLATRDLPDLKRFAGYRPYQTAYFFDRNGEVIGCMPGPTGEWRDVIRPEEARTLLIAKLILAVEDKRFFERDSTADIRAILRAAKENLLAGKVVEGGSTIPIQLAKQLLPPEERAKKSVGRKVKELVLARRLVKELTKEEIFALYLNEIYLGHQAYGVAAASKIYFNKSVSELNLSEASVLAGSIRSPERVSAKKYPKRAWTVRSWALNKAKEYFDADGKPLISKEEVERTRREPVATSNDFEESCKRAPRFVNYVRKDLEENHNLVFNSTGTNPAWFGLRVITSIDWDAQRPAVEGIKLMVSGYEARQGDMAIDAEGALVLIENETGAILAMVGGKNYSQRKFNHAVAPAKRQIGSAFKLFVYLAKLEQELAEKKPASPESLLDTGVSNAKIRCPRKWRADPNKPEDWWAPQNFDEKRYADSFYTRRFAIAKSINLPAVHTARVGCGLNPRVIAMAERLGLKDPIQPYLPSALGASSHPLLEVVRAYSVLPSRGMLRPNYTITKISNAEGKEIFQKTSWTPATPVISETLARVMTEALRGAVKFGTAISLSSLTQPIACKTGTTNNFTDALIFCFTPDVTIGVWMGGPESYKRSLGDKEFGARTAVAVKHVVENWYRGQDPRPFLEESKELLKLQRTPDLFKKEVEKFRQSDFTDNTEEN